MRTWQWLAFDNDFFPCKMPKTNLLIYIFLLHVFYCFLLSTLKYMPKCRSTGRIDGNDSRGRGSRLALVTCSLADGADGDQDASRERLGCGDAAVRGPIPPKHVDRGVGVATSIVLWLESRRRK